MTDSATPQRPSTPIQKPAAPTRPTPTHPPNKATVAFSLPATSRFSMAAHPDGSPIPPGTPPTPPPSDAA